MKTSKSLSNTVGSRINEFDSWQTQIVGNFNELFPECPIKGYNHMTQVRIGEPAAGNYREIFLDGDLIIHKMYSDLLYGVEKVEDETDKELDFMDGHVIYE